MWLYEKTLGKRREGVYELKRLYKDLRARSWGISRAGKTNRITIANDPDIGDAEGLVRRFSSDLAVFRQVLLKKQYKPLTDYVQECGDAHAIRAIVDAGANTGYTTLFLNRKFPHARIVSIEPDPESFMMLLDTIARNKLERIKPIQSGLWSTNEPLAIDKTFRDKRSWSFRVQPSNEASSIPGVTMRTLMDTFTMPSIDILKIDIEGGEVAVFAEDSAVAAFLPRVRYLAIEIHDEFRIRPAIMTHLKRHGFSHMERGELTIARNLTFAPRKIS